MSSLCFVDASDALERIIELKDQEIAELRARLLIATKAAECFECKEHLSDCENVGCLNHFCADHGRFIPDAARFCDACLEDGS